MRIMIFTEVLSPYVCGISSYVDALKKGLEALHHQVLIVTSSLHTKQSVFKNGIVRCPARRCGNKYGYECRNISDKNTIDFLKSFRPDVIHIHTDTRIGYMGLLLADKVNKPVVFTIHDYYNDRFSDRSKFVWTIKTMIEKKHFCDMIDNADVLTSSSRRASLFIKNAGRKRRVKLIPSGTDIRRFDYRNTKEVSVLKMRRKLEIPEDTVVAVFSGGLTVDKNLEFVLSAISKYTERGENFKFLIVGSGTEEEYLHELCYKLRINDRVMFLGEAAHSIMPQIYSACDIYVCSYDDGLMSMSFLEAMACGLPVLIKEDKEKFVRKMIQDGVNGFVYKNEKEFAKYLKILSNIDDFQKMQIKRVVRRTVAGNTSTAMAEHYIKAYQKAIKARRLKHFA